MTSFVYFDLGGVVELDFYGTNKWEELKRDIGVNERNNKAYERVWNLYDKNMCIDFDVDDLIPLLKKEAHLTFPTHYSMLTDIVNRFERNPSLWPVIEMIHKTIPVGLL